MLDSMSLSASQGNYNTGSHKGLQSQYSMPTTTRPLQQSYRGPASEPSQFPSRKPVGQLAKRTYSDSNDSRAKRPPRGISTDPRDLIQALASPSPGLSSGENRRSFPGISDI
jgi:hypothetical protein